ncbi:MAG: TonB-dependent receptor [Acidobacteria bacterium]|nr:TonB-dependent receptor [Acidobacteriota bacterium]
MSLPIRNSLRLFAAIALFLLAVPLAQAQFRTAIQGTVTDPTGAVIPGATLTLLDKQTNQAVTAKTNEAGIYNFNALPPSSFQLTATMTGFATKVIDNLKLIPEQSNNLNVVMSIGESATTITVNSHDQVPGLDTQTASIGGVITEQQLTHLPAFGRDVTTLAQLAPGTLADGGQGASGGVRNLPGTNQGGAAASDGIYKVENGPQVVGNGNQTNTNGIQIDGISATSAVWGGTTVVTPTQESVENVKVTANPYDAEFGRYTGTQIQITSKSGTNQLHGSLFFKADRPGLNAYQRWNGPNSVFANNPITGVPQTPQQRGLNRDTQRFNQYGGSLGGPVWKDKIFGFFAYETLRLKTTNYGTGWFETPALLTRATANSIASKYTTYPGMGVQSLGLTSNNTCAALGLVEGPYCHALADGMDVGSPLTTGLGTYDTSRTTVATQPGYGSGLDGVADIANYAVYTGSSREANQYYGRVDGQVTSKDRLSGMIYWVPVISHSVNGPARGINQYVNNRKNYAFTALWNHTFSPTLLNEARANAAGWRWNEVDSNPNTPFGLGPTNFSDTRQIFPNTSISSFAPSSPSVFNQWTFGYQDILTKVAGRHTIKAGATLTRLYYLAQSPGASRLTYNFANIWNFLNDAPYSESGSFNPATGQPTSNRFDDRENLWGAFVQDNWKLSPGLTVTLGLRYDYYGPLYDKDDKFRVAQLGSGSSLVSGLHIRKGGDLYTAQKSNFGPQVGFAWNPAYFERKVVIRGGFGINYNQNEIAITSGVGGNPGNTLNFSFCCKQNAAAGGTTGTGSSIQEATSSDLKSPFYFPQNSTAVTTYDANGLPLTGTISVTTFDPNPKTIQTYHYSLDTQYDLGKQWVATLGYQGSISHHLLLQQDVNILAAAQGYSLNPRLSRVGMYSNKGNANYNALLATIKHNFARHYQMEAQYTWSKSMDNGSSPYYEDAYPQNLAYSYGRSDYNVQNAFKLFGMYETSFFSHRNYILHALADGFTITGIFNWHTGFPWTPTYGMGGSAYYGNSGKNTFRPAAYYGNGGNDLSNAAFKTGTNSGNTAARNKNFPNADTRTYFSVPFTPVSNTFPNAGTLPPVPGVARNSFTGPGYQSIDASLAKAFHLPHMPVLGEHANLEFRIDAFNLFNQTNLTGVNSSLGSWNAAGTVFTPSNNFGQAQGGLAGRIMDMQARFSF